jgi:hypothetical protein
MEEKTATFTVDVPFDELTKAVYHKMRIVQVNEGVAYFEKKPTIINTNHLEGVIIAKGDKCEIEFNLITTKHSKYTKRLIGGIAVVLAIIIFSSELDYSTKFKLLLLYNILLLIPLPFLKFGGRFLPALTAPGLKRFFEESPKKYKSENG